MDGFDLQVTARLPLAEAAYRVLSHVLSDSFLADLYDRHRGRGYEREISFAALVGIVRDALLVHPSARQVMEKAKEAEELPAQNCSFYQKLGRLDVGLSMAFVRETAALLEPLAAPSAAALPASLGVFDVIVLDGKTIKHVSHRLKATRPFHGRATGGKFLAALSMKGEMIRAIQATPDSNTNDVPLVRGLLLQLQRAGQKLMLFIADRQFGGVQVPLDLIANGNHFLIRYQKNVGFEADESRPALQGVDSRGRSYQEQWGWIGAGRRLYARRITLRRDGLDDVILVSDLLDEKQFPAADLLTAYLERWTIERVFQQVTEVYELHHLIGSTPQGTIFQASFCLLLYNLLQVIKSHVAAGGKLKPREVSGELLFDDLTAQMIAWNILLPVAATLRMMLPPMEADALRRHLSSRLRPLWTPRWRKSPKKKPTRAAKKRSPPGGSLCVHRAQIAYARKNRGKPRRDRAARAAGHARR
jgi:Transposase DDE domain